MISDYLCNILQLSTRGTKCILIVEFNSRAIEMEFDSGVDHSTVLLSIFEQSSADVCVLRISFAEECLGIVRIND